MAQGLSMSMFPNKAAYEAAVASLSKPLVKYKSAGFEIKVGHAATVIPLDHPDEYLVTNGQIAHTSRVVSYDKATGNFETRNTRYELVKE